MTSDAIKLLLGLIVIGAYGSAHAMQNVSLAKVCGPFSGSTYMCSEAWTALNFLEAYVFSGGSVHVTGTFNGPGYYVQLQATEPVFLGFPSTWTARVVMPYVCAYSGSSSAEGWHWAQGTPLPISGPYETASFHVQWYCDCDGHVP